jgi:hypothetical protein
MLTLLVVNEINAHEGFRGVVSGLAVQRNNSNGDETEHA